MTTSSATDVSVPLDEVAVLRMRGSGGAASGDHSLLGSMQLRHKPLAIATSSACSRSVAACYCRHVCEASCSPVAGMAQAMCAQLQAARLVAMIMLQGLCQLR
jgi:hypothetical protein